MGLDFDIFHMKFSIFQRHIEHILLFEGFRITDNFI